MGYKIVISRGTRLFSVLAVLTAPLLYFCFNATIPPQQADLLSQLRQVQQRTAPTFDLAKATIPVNEIQSGGPPKDGIPALSSPQVVSAEQANFLKKDDLVIGVAIADRSRAYPISILTQHEIVNDRLGDISMRSLTVHFAILQWYLTAKHRWANANSEYRVCSTIVTS